VWLSGGNRFRYRIAHTSYKEIERPFTLSHFFRDGLVLIFASRRLSHTTKESLGVLRASSLGIYLKGRNIQIFKPNRVDLLLCNNIVLLGNYGINVQLDFRHLQALETHSQD